MEKSHPDDHVARKPAGIDCRRICCRCFHQFYPVLRFSHTVGRNGGFCPAPEQSDLCCRFHGEYSIYCAPVNEPQLSSGEGHTSPSAAKVSYQRGGMAPIEIVRLIAHHRFNAARRYCLFYLLLYLLQPDCQISATSRANDGIHRCSTCAAT